MPPFPSPLRGSARLKSVLQARLRRRGGPGPGEGFYFGVGPVGVGEGFGEVDEVRWALEVGGEEVGVEAAVHVGTEGEDGAGAGDGFDVGDVAEDVGDGGAARGEFGGGDEEAGEE